MENSSTEASTDVQPLDALLNEIDSKGDQDTGADVEGLARQLDGDVTTDELDKYLAEWEEEGHLEATNEADDDDLDALLSEYEEQDASQENSPDNGSNGSSNDRGPDERLDRLEQWAKDADGELAYRRERDDLHRTVEAIRQDLDGRADYDTIEMMLNRLADERPSIKEAWAGRYRDPGRWQAIFEGASQRINRRLDEMVAQREIEVRVDKERVDKELAATFVRGSSTREIPEKPMSADRLSGLSDSEFNKYTRDLLKRK